jgi:hypothetical protein
MVKERIAQLGQRRSFQITFGLKEEHGDKHTHSKEDVLRHIGTWMLNRTRSKKHSLASGILVFGTAFTMQWSDTVGHNVQPKDVAMFCGDVLPPLYSTGVRDDDEAIREALEDLASHLGTELKLNRVEIIYRTELIVLKRCENAAKRMATSRNATVHARRFGVPLCGFTTEPHIDHWPEDHTAADIEEVDRITCPICKTMAQQQSALVETSH